MQPQGRRECANAEPLTAGGFLALWESERETGAARVLALAQAAVARQRSRAGPDDLAQEVAVRLTAGDAAAARRVPPETPLPALVRGVVRNVRREANRSRRERDLGDGAALVPDRVGAELARTPEARENETGKVVVSGRALSPGQQEVVTMLSRGATLAVAADRLGISETAALRRLRRAAIAPPPRPRAGDICGKAGWPAEEERRQRRAAIEGRRWAASLLAADPPGLDATDRAVLEGLAGGLFLSEIAARLHRSYEAVRSRVKRLRERWR